MHVIRHLTTARRSWFAAALTILLQVPGALASQQEEITHLFDYIVQTGCTFIRNGSEYTASDARDHMQMKYDYVRGRIDSTEEMIRYVATRSSMTGRRYKVRCGGQEHYSAEWLNAELERYRHRQGTPQANGASPQSGADAQARGLNTMK